ncbi:polysaccharide pyruvyl transferase family protein [Vibrio parahaemolyticus]|uniref:polysaccharide pyruvyl transferase family protein n=1 Tax=Vibrio parahaemolyticus TaxID=670 RepID=UPI00128F01B3|nr:polysaccharide pyruvyl transferase family protein [Vibrio parahaemolyticus]MQF60399.1 polysaccharide pyruvyl transferase family protein [Vibrio parahaemolyticus]
MKNKKIGILNFHYSTHNYGAVLQAGAINNSLKDLGYDVEQINYIPHENKLSFYALRRILAKVKSKIENREKNKDLSKVKNSVVFENFREKWLNVSSDNPITDSELKNLATRYFAVIVGSDQVWRPSMTQESALRYFLDFVSPKTRRISYAASFGVDYWKPALIPFFTKRVKYELNKFYAISVREDSGVKICKEISGVEAEHVLDPTLLVGREYFDTVINQGSKRLSDNECTGICYYKIDMPPSFTSAIETLSKVSGRRLNNIYYSEENGFLSVENWLSSIKNSHLMVTDSFHCVCFSLLFNKPFIYLPNDGRGMSRIHSLLGKLGLEFLICHDVKDINSVYVKSQKINYDEVNLALSREREKSKLFLKKSLSHE